VSSRGSSPSSLQWDSVPFDVETAIAYPAVYRSSGVMTFFIDQNDVVYEKPIGLNTLTLARAMTAHHPSRFEFPLKRALNPKRAQPAQRSTRVGNLGVGRDLCRRLQQVATRSVPNCVSHVSPGSVVCTAHPVHRRLPSMPAYSWMFLIDAGLLIAYAILSTHALASLANMLPLSGSHPVEGL
jgi:hypothetical protein